MVDGNAPAQVPSLSLRAGFTGLGRGTRRHPAVYIEITPVFRLLDVRLRWTVFALVVLLAVAFSGCRRGALKTSETAYVSAPQVNLRDRLSPIYNKTGLVYNGEQVEVLEKSRRFARVKSRRGEVGWMEQRYLVSPDVFDALNKLAAENRSTPVQGKAAARASLNIHVEPGRDTEHLYQLKGGDKVEILGRATADKPQTPGAIPTRIAKPAAKKEEKGKKDEPPAGPLLEDWTLVRDAQGHVGWVLARMLDAEVPLDVAQYAEGQRIVAYFILNHVRDGDEQVPQYLTLMTEPRDGLPFDYNQARIFTWNTKRHRYETAYRERNLNGVFPASAGTETFGAEGVQPVFTLRVKDEQGSVSEKKYRLIGPIVRRVLTAQQEQQEKEARAARMASRPARRKR
jgi:SH3-like domain-containing protein